MSGNYNITNIAENIITKHVSHVERIKNLLICILEDTNGKLVGLENCLKSLDSAIDSIHRISEDTHQSIEDSAETLTDVLRFTVIDEPQNLVRTFLCVDNKLITEGFEVNTVKNTFTVDNFRYRGVNTVIMDSKCMVAFEIQFHTPASYEIKMRTHDLYKEWKNTKEISKRQELEQQMASQYSGMIIPKDIALIKNRTFQQ